MLSRTRCCAMMISLILPACGLAHQAKIQKDADSAQAEADRAASECERLHPDKNRKPVTPRTQCFNDARLNYGLAMDRSIGNLNLDLFRLSNARMLVVAERFDSGKTTVAQFELEKAEAQANFNDQIAARHNSATIAAAAQQQAAAASQQATAASEQSINSAVTAATSTKPVSCSRIGNTVTCY